ncbi:helix-turn-helix domain-containing protein [Paenibacillus hexagrammi]|uniref:Helix-turn-helix domain-containing protein n=1 Tax=Paenibacillus hexagrammi TaxID=2908839 RepID=A0ABY3SL00_9BACL|nr:helix-turn-helix transcriptional regulator [Paenibacillus sp. YPD9-1]UJF34533.1 helix-turn-helix domain-containing protein [Paenibacillus sp. YPD9-1]
MTIFSRRFHELRTQKNVTQDELAAYLDKKRATVSNYELGKTEPQFEDLVKIADYFQVSIDYLLGRPGAVKHFSSFQDSSGVQEDNALLTSFLKSTEALLREKGNLGEDKLASSLKFMEFTFMEDLQESNRKK